MQTLPARRQLADTAPAVPANAGLAAAAHASHDDADDTMGTTMLACVAPRYGAPDVVGLATVLRPVPQANEVLVRVLAASVGAADGAARRGKPRLARLFFGLRRPKLPILGSDFAGVVAAVGPQVTRFSPGQRVFGLLSPSFGAHAEYVCLPADAALEELPAHIDPVDAVAMLDCTALPFLRDHARLQPGQRILINGAVGSVGSMAVQLAKVLGADVTAVCSTQHLDTARRLGADYVIDYTQLDVCAWPTDFDVVFDAVGKLSFGRCHRLLRPGGVYLTTVPSLRIFPQMLITRWFGSRRAVVAFTGLRPVAEQARDLASMRELIDAGRLVSLIAGCYAMADIAPAYALVDSGHKCGTVVIRVG